MIEIHFPIVGDEFSSSSRPIYGPYLGFELDEGAESLVSLLEEINPRLTEMIEGEQLTVYGNLNGDQVEPIDPEQLAANSITPRTDARIFVLPKGVKVDEAGRDELESSSGEVAASRVKLERIFGQWPPKIEDGKIMMPSEGE